MEINSVLLFALMVVGRVRGLPAIPTTTCAEYCISRNIDSNPIDWRDACKCYYNRLEPVQTSESTPKKRPQNALPLLPSSFDDTSIYYQPAVNAPLQSAAALVDFPFYIIDPTFKSTTKLPEKETKNLKADSEQADYSNHKSNLKDPVYLDIVIADADYRAAKNSEHQFLSEKDLSDCIDLHMLAFSKATNNVIPNIKMSIGMNSTSYESLSDDDIKVEMEKKCFQAHSLVNETIYEILRTRPKKIQTLGHDLNELVRITDTDRQISRTNSFLNDSEKSSGPNNQELKYVPEVCPNQSGEDMIIKTETNFPNTSTSKIMDITSEKYIEINMTLLPPLLANTSVWTTDIPQSYQITSNSFQAAVSEDTEDSEAYNSFEKMTTTFRSQTTKRPLLDIKVDSDKALENDHKIQNTFKNPITTARYTDTALKDKAVDYMQTHNIAAVLKNETEDTVIHSVFVNNPLTKQAIDDQINSNKMHALNVTDPVFTTDKATADNSLRDDIFYYVSRNEKQENSDAEFISPDTTSAVQDYTEEILNNNSNFGTEDSSENNELKRATNYGIVTSTEVASIKVVDQQIPKIITRELFNESVVSGTSGVEAEPEDVIENYEAHKADKKNKDHDNNTSKLIIEKSSEIIGNLYFKSKNAEVPVILTQNAKGRLSIGIDGDSLCNKLLAGNRKQVFFTMLCDCVRNNSC